MRRILPRFGGREVETAGDSFLLEFGSALAALQAVAAIQVQLAAENARTGKPVLLRASIHTGDIEHRGSEVYGDGVNVAARLLPLSPPGGMAISAPVRMQARPLSLELSSIGSPSLKNIDTPIEVFIAKPEALQSLGTSLGATTWRIWARRSTRALAGIAAVLAIAGAALAIQHLLTNTGVAGVGAAGKHSMAVLPFTNVGGDPADEYFSDGLSEELISTLGRLRGVRVIGRHSSFQFKGRTDDVRTIGARLGVSYLLAGSVRRAAQRVRISVELVRAADGTNVWTESYDREISDIFTVQSEIALAVASRLQPALLNDAGGGALAANPDAPPSRGLDAYNALLKGNFYYERQTAEDLRVALDHYHRAVSLDPQYALAYARMARAATDRVARFAGLTGKEREAAIADARSTAATALRLDPLLAEAHSGMGFALELLDFDFTGAEAAYRRAVELAPQNPKAVLALARVLADLGRLDEAVRQVNDAIALDPLSRNARFILAHYLAPQGRYRETEAAVQDAIELQPKASQSYAYLAAVRALSGNPAGALDAARLEPDPFWRTWALAIAQTAHGDQAAANAALATLVTEHAEGAAFQIAQIYAFRKDPEQAFAWLDRAVASRDAGVTQLRWDSFLVAYANDPRYIALARKIGVMPDV